MSETYDTFKALHNSAGMRYYTQQKIRAFSYHVFRGNLEELRKGCEILENSDIGLKLISEAHRSEGVQAHKELNRLFHNFLASAQSLVEHTRVFVRQHYADTPTEQSYQEKVANELANNELCRFIQDLRNYMLHKGLPNSSMSLTFSKIGNSEGHNLVSTISLDRGELQEWKKWSSFAKRYLEKSENEILLSKISSDYGEIIITFYEWFDRKLAKHHKLEIKEFEQLERKYQFLQEQEGEARNAP